MEHWSAIFGVIADQTGSGTWGIVDGGKLLFRGTSADWSVVSYAGGFTIDTSVKGSPIR